MSTYLAKQFWTIDAVLLGYDELIVLNPLMQFNLYNYLFLDRTTIMLIPTLCMQVISYTYRVSIFYKFTPSDLEFIVYYSW